MDRYKVKEIISKENAKTFGKRMAKSCDEIRSSHVFFIIQQAYPELNEWLMWEDCQKLLNKILGIKDGESK